MAYKLAAAKMAAWSGVRTVIAAADRPSVLADAVGGTGVSVLTGGSVGIGAGVGTLVGTTASVTLGTAVGTAVGGTVGTEVGSVVGTRVSVGVANGGAGLADGTRTTPAPNAAAIPTTTDHRSEVVRHQLG